MSVHKLPSKVINKIDKICRYFSMDPRKTQQQPSKPCKLVNDLPPKGIGRSSHDRFTSIFNQMLLLKWRDKFFLDHYHPWKMLVDHCYHGNGVSKIITPCIKRKAFPFWKNVMQVGHLISTFTAVRAGNGKQTSFWQNTWEADRNLKSIFPTLYCLTMNKSGNYVEAFMNKPNIKENFRWPLPQ